mmetsp:Transcript_103279/g.245991  ORF Transcript_103279/g.245991 Transcript_103279/m.245991 type:complete len:440 (+) Transcript_103279:130-1449(+)
MATNYPGMPDPATMQAMLGGMPPGTAPAADGSVPPFDPATAAAYMQMMQYIQQGLQQSSFPLPAASPMFPGLPPAPYTPAMPAEPAITVSVEGMKFQYQLTEDDLHKVFSRYGAVKQIRVDEAGAGASAQIIFEQFPEAQAAMNDLNGKVLNGLEGTLRIQWASPPPAPYPGVPFPGWGFPPGQSWPAPPASISAGTGPANSAEKSPGKSQRKYTCRFIIGIENDKDFQVARRIIGAKGTNMKRIVKQTEAKLRLRGVGSGYFEGAGQKESSEPLQLCISCTSQDGYKTAVKGVEELLNRVYDEYRQFCRENGKPVPDLQINFTENQLVYSSRAPFSAGLDDDEGDGKDKRKNKAKGAKREPAKSADGAIDRGEPGPNAPPVQEIEKLIDERNEARRANNFPEADRIRQLLHNRGVALMDEPGGRGKGAEVTTWRYWRD